MIEVPFLVYEVLSPSGKTFVAHVDKEGGFLRAFEIDDDIIESDFEKLDHFKMCVNKPISSFNPEEGLNYLPVWGISIDDQECTAFELLAQVEREDRWNEFLNYLYQNGLETIH